MMALGLLGMLGIVIGIVWVVVALFKRSDKKKPLITILVSFIAMFVGVLNSPSSSEASSDTKESVEEVKKSEPSSSKEEKQKQTEETEEVANDPESKFKNILKDDGIDDGEVTIENNNVVIVFYNDNIFSGNDWIKRQFPDSVLPLLKVAKEINVDNIIVKTTTEFVDNKGNSSDDLAISIMYSKENLNDINFDNWETQVNNDGTILYQVSDAYHINPGVYKDVKEKTKESLGSPNKTADNDFWYDNGLNS